MAPEGQLGLAPTVETQIVDPLYIVRVRELVIDADIGIHPHEQGRPQRVQVDITVEVLRPDGGFSEDYRRVYCYERLVEAVRAMAASGHIQLVETLADRIAEFALTDPRARRAEVTIEKLDVFADAAAVGVTVSRRRLA